jgi:hypothetical protein
MTRAWPRTRRNMHHAPMLTALRARSSDARASGYAEAVVTVDNHTSKAHTVLQARAHARGATVMHA